MEENCIDVLGLFLGAKKGLSLIWEKEWGSIPADRYCQRIVPLIHGMISSHPHIQLMQDNAPPHKARQTMDDLRERNTSPITWPPYSPDLSPIEHVWKLMKDCIAYHYPDLAPGNNRLQDELGRVVAEA